MEEKSNATLEKIHEAAMAEFLYEAAADQQMYSRKMPIFYREG